jgi:hypothetical protein
LAQCPPGQALISARVEGRRDASFVVTADRLHAQPPQRHPLVKACIYAADDDTFRSHVAETAAGIARAVEVKCCAVSSRDHHKTGGTWLSAAAKEVVTALARTASICADFRTSGARAVTEIRPRAGD